MKDKKDDLGAGVSLARQKKTPIIKENGMVDVAGTGEFSELKKDEIYEVSECDAIFLINKGFVFFV
jgi:hypothetical protein